MSASSALSQVTMTPPKSVLFTPSNTKQTQNVEIKNGSEHIVTFKMKHTRPGVYKLRPVFGCIPPGESKSISVLFKGLKPSMKCPTKDRFSCVLAIAPSNISNTAKMWKNPKFMETLASNDMTKKNFAILFEGVNDQAPLPKSNEDVSLKEKKGKVVKKGAGSVDREDEEEKASAEKAAADQLAAVKAAAEKDKAAAVAAAIAATKGNAPQQKAAIVVMFRERPPESKSDDEDDDDEDGATTKPTAPAAAKAAPTKSTTKINGKK